MKATFLSFSGNDLLYSMNLSTDGAKEKK